MHILSSIQPDLDICYCLIAKFGQSYVAGYSDPTIQPKITAGASLLELRNNFLNLRSL